LPGVHGYQSKQLAQATKGNSMSEAPAKRWRLLLYSDPKVGKTTLAETTVGPRLILDAEGGTSWMATETVEWDPKNPPPTGLGPDVSVVAHITSWDQVEMANSWLQRGDHEFKSVVLDSLTEIQKVCKLAISQDGFKIQDWGTLYDKMDPVLREIRDLTSHPTNPLWQVVITALAKVQDEKIMPDIQGSMARSLAGQIDTIGYLRTGSMAPDGSVGRELVVDPSSKLYAGDRTKVLRRTFKGVVPIVLNEDTDEIQWNLGQLLKFMNQPKVAE
tara:strand:+ start:979 stop:1797 length:819 start_codon:yes stop_codon:yes gene_type:complete